ncbi:MAG: hypothetical protein WAW13_00620 [Minisyncoccia bacterium]
MTSPPWSISNGPDAVRCYVTGSLQVSVETGYLVSHDDGHVALVFTLEDARAVAALPEVVATVGELREALADHDARVAELPCAPGKTLPKICPRCNAGPRDVCGPSTSAHYRFSEIARLALSKLEGKA